MRWPGLSWFVALAVLIAVAQAAQAEPIAWPTSAGGNGHRYEVEVQPFTWDEAKAYAARRGGYLATLTTRAEHDFVLGLLRTSDGQLNPSYWGVGVGRRFGPWIGAYQTSGAGNPRAGWQWDTGEPFDFTAWHYGEPNDNNGLREEVAVFFFNPADSNTPGWNDEVRQNRHQSIVEFDPPIAPAVVTPPIVPPVVETVLPAASDNTPPSSSEPVASASAPRSSSTGRNVLGIVALVIGILGAPLIGVGVYFASKMALRKGRKR